MKKISLKKIIFSLLISLLLISCSTVIKNFEDYSSIGAGRAPLAPAPNEIKTEQTKIVLYAIEDKTNNTGNSAVSRIVSTTIQGSLRETNVSILDRSALEQFSEEAILTATETGEDAEFSAASYALKGQIDQVNSYSHYTPEYTETIPAYTIIQNGKEVTIPEEKKFYPATCEYVGEVAGRFEIYSLPALEQTLVIPLNGRDSDTVVSSSGVSLISELTDNTLLKVGTWALASGSLDSKCRNQNLQVSTVSKAAKKSIPKKEKKRLLNQFAAQGYVSDIRRYKNKYIIQITLGTKNGMKQERKVNIYRVREKLNALSGESTKESIQIAKGKTSQLVESDTAWLVVKKNKEAEKILIGDTVKVIY